MKIGRYKITIKKIEKSIFEEDTSNLFSEFIERCKDKEEANRNSFDIYKFSKFIKKFVLNNSKRQSKKEVIKEWNWKSELITMEVILRREVK